MKRLWAVGFAMLLLGFSLTTQYRVTQIVNAPALRSEELSRELVATTRKLQAVQRSNAALRAEIDKLATAGAGNTVEIPLRDVNLELWAGTAPAKGKGVILSVSADKDRGVVIADNDLWLIIQELWAAGAEGIAVNRQRLTTVSEVRQITNGGMMMINGMLMIAPYEVDVVGNPQNLETALKKAGGVVSWLARSGIRVQVYRSEQVVLPSYGPPPDFMYLLPTE